MCKTIVAFGELLWDLLPDGKILGGAPANFIFRINNFGNNGLLISSLGNDDLGKKALEKIRQLGITDKYIQTNPQFLTGTVPVSLSDKGIPDFTIIPNVAYDYIELSPEIVSIVKNADCLYFGTLVQRSGTSKDTLRRLIDEASHVIKFFDINLRKDCYNSEIILESLLLCDVVKLNDEELISLKSMLKLKGKTLRELAIEIMNNYQIELVLITLGEKGAFVVSNDGQYHYEAGYKINLKDTIGSGDAFSAGFIHNYLNGESLEESLKFGNATGAIVAESKGGTHPVTKNEIIYFMKQEHERTLI